MTNKPDISPRFGANAPTEMMIAAIPRQQCIFWDRTYPTDRVGNSICELQITTGSRIASNLEGIAVVEGQIAILNPQTPEIVRTQEPVVSSVGEVEALIEMLDEINLKGATLSLVAVSAAVTRIRPEIVRWSENHYGQNPGATKFHSPKTNQFNDHSAGYVSRHLGIVPKRTNGTIGVSDEHTH